MFDYNGVKITWLGHDGFKIQDSGETLIIDPFKLSRDEKADYVLVSHEHFDHCNPEDLNKVVRSNTTVVAPEACKKEISKANPKEIKTVRPGDTIRVGKFEVKAVPAYNTNKGPEPGKHYHPKSDGKVGYVIKTSNGTSIYHTGDSDVIPEMENLAPDVALLPVSGTYVMTWDEAVQAAGKIKPKVAIPMHFGTIVGSVSDAENFKRKAPVRVEILTAG